MHMGVVTLLVVVFFGSILLISYRGMESETDARADALLRSRSRQQQPQPFAAAEINGWGITAQFPFIQRNTARRPYEVKQGESEQSDSTQIEFEFRISEAEGPLYTIASGFPHGFSLSAINAIYLVTDDAGAVVSVESPYEFDEAFYSHIAGAAQGKKPVIGKLRLGDATLKYARGENALLFIDVTSEANFFGRMLASMLLIALPLLALLFLMSLFFANRSIKPIEVSYNRQREFIADASHELKTPLAAISTNLEALSAADECERPKWQGYIQDEVGRMSALTGNLLYLAKMDYDAPQAFLPVDFSAIVRGVMLPLAAMLYEKGVESSENLTEGVVVDGDAEELRRLVSMLYDNAARYADGRIEVALYVSQGSAVLTIGNDGPGIPEGELESVWERFYRCDASRQCDGGYGLGLPTVRAIAKRHGGRVTCESLQGVWTSFKVELPQE